MKKYAKEIVILCLQICVFYLLPLNAGSGDEMGLMFGMLLATLILSAILGCISKEKVKFLYPIVAALSFIPSVWIYHNESAYIHAAWHFAASLIGLLIGSALREVVKGHD